jgi:DNA-binding transcriptional MerR regulator
LRKRMGMSSREQPLYNIGVVTRVTGMTADTLRVWEQRYGFPKSTRTPGGHRLYSENDIERIRWVKGQIDRGMKTGQAVRALLLDTRQGSLPAPIPVLRRAEEELSLDFDAHAQRLLSTLAAHDLERAERMMGEMLAFYSPEELALKVMLPVLRSIGSEWAEGRMSVATEHLASGFLRERLLMWLVTGPSPRAVKPVVLACAPGEWHDGGLLMLGMLLRRKGWPIAYLGQDVPLPDLATFVHQTNPSAVVLTAMTEDPARALLEWPRYLFEDAPTGTPPVGYGGAIYTRDRTWIEKMPGLFLGSTIEEGVTSIEGLISR